jgi:hypothetical protein
MEEVALCTYESPAVAWLLLVRAGCLYYPGDLHLLPNSRTPLDAVRRIELRLVSTIPLEPPMKICVPLFVKTIRCTAPITVTS